MEIWKNFDDESGELQKWSDLRWTMNTSIGNEAHFNKKWSSLQQEMINFNKRLNKLQKME